MSLGAVVVSLLVIGIALAIAESHNNNFREEPNK
jgi:hypothetical protein